MRQRASANQWSALKAPAQDAVQTGELQVAASVPGDSRPSLWEESGSKVSRVKSGKKEAKRRAKRATPLLVGQQQRIANCPCLQLVS